MPGPKGTWGSAVVTGIMLLLVQAGVNDTGLGWAAAALALHGGLVTIIFGKNLITADAKDPSLIVSDEECGQAISYLPLFWLGGHFSTCGGERMLFLVVGFFLFRIFDILKPPPIRNLEKVPGAWGVLLDDVLAGVCAAAVLTVWKIL